MWIATIDGFFSVVQDRHDHRHVLVRMRSRADWDRAVARFWPFKMYRLTYTHEADYPWRVSVLKYAWQRYLSRAVNAITYDNFKNAVHEVSDDRAKTYMDVWVDLQAIEDEPDSGVAHKVRWRDRDWTRWDRDDWAEQDARDEWVARDRELAATTAAQSESLWDRWQAQHDGVVVGELSDADRRTIAELLDAP